MKMISPSLLSADFGNLQRDIEMLNESECDWLHVDVMDGLFVPNISVGMPVIESIRQATELFLDVHLMIDRPHRYAGTFCEMGADLVNFHVESDTEESILHAIATVKKCGKKVGVTIKPRTQAEAILPFIEYCDLILVMTVEPGFGHQRFMMDQLPKINRVRGLLERYRPTCELEVDGGINESTARLCVQAGADVLVAGSAVFGREDRAAAIRAIRENAMKA